MVFMIMFMNITIYCQSTPNTIFTNGDKIRIELTGNSNFIYVHEIEKGQSLYALSKIFNIPINQLYDINKLNPESTISIGQQIKVPVIDDNLFKGTSLSGLKHGHYIPVYYQTKPKDNLFRISRVYFNQATEDLVKRNNFLNNNLSLGQDILIGWFPIHDYAPNVRQEEFEEEFETQSESESATVNEEEQPSVQLDIDNKTLDIDSESIQDSLAIVNYPVGFNLTLLGSLLYSDNMQEIKKSEVANWDKSMPDNGTVFVLHRNAIIDSYIEMYNPTMKRSVRAKVIGRIPYGAYTNDVDLVLSPRAAKQLRALDNRFKVEVKMLIES